MSKSREQRINELMRLKGMSRAEAEANQRGAISQGADLNNDGAVNNIEYGRFKGLRNDPDFVKESWFEDARGDDMYFGPQEIHNLVNSGKISWKQAEEYFGGAGTQEMNLQHRKGGKGRTAEGFALNADGTGMNMREVLRSGNNSAVSNFDRDRFYQERGDVLNAYKTDEGAADKARVDAMNKFYGTNKKDLRDFSDSQFGYWHTQHHKDSYGKGGKGGDYYSKGYKAPEAEKPPAAPPPPKTEQPPAAPPGPAPENPPPVPQPPKPEPAPMPSPAPAPIEAEIDQTIENKIENKQENKSEQKAEAVL